MADRTKIDWCDASINPWGWGCYGPGGSADQPRVCFYCYAKRLAQRGLRTCPECRSFVPHWHEEELEKPFHWKRPRRIFIESMGDPFGEWVTREQVGAIMHLVAAASQHTYYLLTKQPQNINLLFTTLIGAVRPATIYSSAFFRNLWIGASIDTAARARRVEKYMGHLDEYGWHTFASIEPLLEDIEGSRWLLPYRWIIIGAMTGPSASQYPVDRAWIDSIIDGVDRRGTPVFVKRSLAHISTRQEFPKEG